jgi:molybdenum cofactor guanylyltransferase
MSKEWLNAVLQSIIIKNQTLSMDHLTGVILCGGESRRMGRDKGLILRGDKPWAVLMAEKLTPFQIPVVYSINQQQREAYSSLIPASQLLVDSLTLPGPLRGLFSVHKAFPDKDLLLLACDMPDLDDHTIRQMVDTYMDMAETGSESGSVGTEGALPHMVKRNNGFDFFVYQDGHFAQPFCGIYTAAGLARAYHEWMRKGDPEHTNSLQRLIRTGRTRTLPIDRPEAFRNYNSLEDPSI